MHIATSVLYKMDNVQCIFCEIVMKLRNSNVGKRES